MDESLIKVADYLNRQVFKRKLIPEVSLLAKRLRFHEIGKSAKGLSCKSLPSILRESEDIAVELAFKEIQQIVDLSRIATLQDFEEVSRSFVPPAEPTRVGKDPSVFKVFYKDHEQEEPTQDWIVLPVKVTIRFDNGLDQ